MREADVCKQVIPMEADGAVLRPKHRNKEAAGRLRGSGKAPRLTCPRSCASRASRALGRKEGGEGAAAGAGRTLPEADAGASRKAERCVLPVSQVGTYPPRPPRVGTWGLREVIRP